MNRKWMVAVSLCAILAWAAGTQQDAKTVISGATKALGAENLKTVEFSGSGFDYVIGQAPNPSSPWPKFNDKSYTRVIDLDAPASRLQRIRTQGENPPRGGGQQPIIGEQTQTQVVAAGSPHLVTQRGNRGQKVFFSDSDYELYLELLAEGAHGARTGV